MIDALLLFLAFALGAALSRTSLCAVASVQQAMLARDYAGLRRLALAACGAGVVLLPLAGLRPDAVLLPGPVAFHAGIIVGGLLLGVGALLNGGCYLGSVLYLGSGNLNFLFTLAGIGAGVRATELLAGFPDSAATMPRPAMGPLWMFGVGGFALVIAALLLPRLRSAAAWLAVGTGVLAGLVYARRPGWSYGTVLDSLAHGRHALMDWTANLSALLLFAGALAGAALAGRFRLQRPTPWRALRCAAGGLVMGFGAALVPGGNDMLLLWAIPGLTIYGALAYGVMLAVIAAGFLAAMRGRGGTVD
ncbi:MAG TPA: YeeE/YedE thiosulfate transporter family protein [Steroidobacteraceae bacterium]|nr:YeeE/YedE thiosulfate transporter family protein [Steroidobacteraceae bacterium]